MSRHNEIQNAYRSLGKDATFYDGMITCSTLPGRAICGLVWNMGKGKNTGYLEKVLDRIPDGFSGKLLEVPVGTGVLTVPVFAETAWPLLLNGFDHQGPTLTVKMVSMLVIHLIKQILSSGEHCI